MEEEGDPKSPSSAAHGMYAPPLSGSSNGYVSFRFRISLSLPILFFFEREIRCGGEESRSHRGFAVEVT